MLLLLNWINANPHLLAATALVLAFALLAWGMRAVTALAAITGALLSLLICAATGPASLAPIITVFLLTVTSTRVGRAKKERMGTIENRRGRNARQILANVAVPAICTAPLLCFPYARYILMAAASAALAEAAGDTVSSELGQLFGRSPRLIINGRRVPVGSDGAITLAGVILALAAIALVAASCVWAGVLLPHFFLTAVAAAFAGTLLDSLLGATLERAGWIGNNSVNFASTAFAAASAILALFVLRWM